MKVILITTQNTPAGNEHVSKLTERAIESIESVGLDYEIFDAILPHQTGRVLAREMGDDTS